VQNIFCIKSESRNWYFINEQKQQHALFHPVLGFIIDLFLHDKDLQKLLTKNKNGILIPDYGYVPKKTLNFYYHKFQYLKLNSSFFEKTSADFSNVCLLNEDIDRGIESIPAIILEVTTNCNLRCKYCSCGELYANSKGLKIINMEPTSAITLLNYVIKKKTLNSQKRQLALSFYGGEPLLNFTFIENLVKYAESLITDVQIRFDIVTNGTLLDKYMDYLVKHKFTILISIDGDENSNQYRIYRNGKFSFNQVFSNIKILQKRYPNFFKSNVNIKSVIHNNNNVQEIISFFKTNIGKVPETTMLRTNNVNPDKTEDFKKISVKYEINIDQNHNLSNLKENIPEIHPELKSIFSCVTNFNSIIISDYIDLLIKRTKKKWNTNTCLPFSKRIFLTADGNILPCEKIGHKYSFGKIENNCVRFEYEKIKYFYNNIFEKLKRVCHDCAFDNKCPQCFFQLDLEKEEIVCTNFNNRSFFKDELKRRFNLMESLPEMLDKIIINNYSL
jgi:uncharacterized protein